MSVGGVEYGDRKTVRNSSRRITAEKREASSARPTLISPPTLTAPAPVSGTPNGKSGAGHGHPSLPRGGRLPCVIATVIVGKNAG